MIGEERKAAVNPTLRRVLHELSRRVGPLRASKIAVYTSAPSLRAESRAFLHQARCW